MKIELNEKPIEVPEGLTLTGLLDHLAIQGEGRAIAIDNRIVPRSAWPTQEVTANQRILIIQAVSGG